VRVRWPALAVACVLATGCGEPAPVEASDAVQRGRDIYLRGVTARGDAFTAELGAGNLVPAAALPCANCHGRDGRGRFEGGIAPPDIRWSSLSRPYQVVSDTGRSRPAYTAPRLGRAITLGIDAGAERLGVAMPRYRLTRAELDDLLAYLQVLEREPQAPGVDETTLRIGLLLDGSASGAGADVAQVLAGSFEAFNRQGGIYGRQLALRTLTLPVASGEQAPALRAFLEREGPLALFGQLPDRGGEVLAALLEEQQVPFIGVRAAATGPPRSPERYVFYVQPGIVQEAAALACFAVRQRARARTVIVHPADAVGEVAARFVAERARRAGAGEVTMRAAVAVAGQIDAAALPPDIAVLVDLGPPELAAGLLAVAARAPALDFVLLPGDTAAAIARDPARFLRPAHQARLAGRLYTVIPESGPPSSGAALGAVGAAGRILVEALKRSGRATGREALVDTLAGLHDFATGLGPIVSFGPERRIGVAGEVLGTINPATGVTRRRDGADAWQRIE